MSAAPSFVARWRLLSDPPAFTGRFCVGHRGQVYGDAYYVLEEDSRDLRMPAGWNQVPAFKPTHWLDAPDMRMNFY